MNELIIDSHVHVGDDWTRETTASFDELRASQHAARIHRTVVCPTPSQQHAAAIASHDELAAWCRAEPGKWYGVCLADPRLGHPGYRSEAERCVRELGFVALKLHTLACALDPLSRAAAIVFETAEELRVPVIVHSGTGWPWSAPSRIAVAAARHPTIPVVVAHAGMHMGTAEATEAARGCPNLFLETSLASGHAVRAAVRVLGASRLMFGSDLPAGANAELIKLRSHLSAPDLNAVLEGTARSVFGLPLSPVDTDGGPNAG